ncbi:DUF1456 family protein [Thalassotalea sp. ND16A]|uniref:DUF1456 family protein n=1 Tax=Thalassotalea sp. ND16A TaxID=1535422 RepID=UPI00051A1DA5|nr:DUF1456 family protein [Thalassotalea sp. ND16A]KGJ99226.1 hypothetical protein ND16A_0376 [Thalassotalea sp. ND16A]
MINNDILRRLCKIFDFNDEKIQAIFALNQCDITTEQLECIFKEHDDSAYQELSDVQLASFLNGLIVEKRGKKDGSDRPAELELSNNIIFNKIKIALALKADEVIAVLELAGLSLGKYELSAYFRNVNNKHFKTCSDDVLSTFLTGLKLKFNS